MHFVANGQDVNKSVARGEAKVEYGPSTHRSDYKVNTKKRQITTKNRKQLNNVFEFRLNKFCNRYYVSCSPLKISTRLH